MKEGLRILVVEDDPSIHRLISFKLELEGYLVTVLTDGKEALSEALDHSYDAIILDLMLPSVDGFQVLKGIRNKKKEIPILILSAKSQEEDVLRCFSYGASDYLVKPFRPNELLIRLRRFLER